MSSPNKTESIADIYIRKSGAMGIRLRMRDKWPQVPCLIGFDRSGGIGEVEASGKICIGHVLIAINDVVLLSKPFDEILEVIRSQPPATAEAPRKLSFSSLDFIRTYQNQYPHVPLDECYHLQSDISYSTHMDYVRDTIGNSGVLDDQRIRCFAQKGLPDGNDGIRSILWKVLMGYLPLDTSSWFSHLDRQRQLYSSLLDEMTITPSRLELELYKNSLDSANGTSTAKFRSVSDHPLHVDEHTSDWAKFWSDSSLLDSIQKDVIRTYPDLKFFLDGDGTHQKALQNILFLFAKLNPAIKYVQGMNELVGTLYYVFANDENDDAWLPFAEADTFFCFSLLMGEIRDMYIHNMDNTSSGITGRIQRFTEVLKAYDADLNDLLLSQGIEPSFYSLRWITTLLSREFDLLDTIRLWDSLLADNDRDEFLCYICTTMVLEQKSALMMGDFGENLSLLQSYPPMDVTHLLRKMEALRQHHSRNEDASSSPYPSMPRETSFSNLSLLQALQKTQDMGALTSGELLSAGINDVWRASASLSKFVSSAGNGIKSAVFKNTSDRYGNVRSFTAFDDRYGAEDWSSLCSTGKAFDLSDKSGALSTMNGECVKKSGDNMCVPIDFSCEDEGEADSST